MKQFFIRLQRLLYYNRLKRHRWVHRRDSDFPGWEVEESQLVRFAG